MRKLMDTKKFSPNVRLLWYAAALTGLLLFCFSPLTPSVNGDEMPVPDDAEETFPAAAVSEGNVTDEAPELSDTGSPAIPVFLMQGDCGSAVFCLQTQLQALGYEVGECSGVYTQQTASAVRRFQLDSGWIGDGVCTAAVSYAIAYLSDSRFGYGAECSEEDLCETLKQLGYWTPVAGEPTEEISHASHLRNALILFQRTHGLYGSGEADYATLCALGMIQGAEVLSEASDGGAADAAYFDLRCRLLSEALADYVLRYPEAYDLYTLTACAAVLCNRADDIRFPMRFDAVCAAGLTAGEERNEEVSSHVPDRDAVERRSRDLLLIRAAEDALRAYLSSDGYDPARGALYVCPTDFPLPPDICVCIRTGDFVFFR